MESSKVVLDHFHKKMHIILFPTLSFLVSLQLGNERQPFLAPRSWPDSETVVISCCMDTKSTSIRKGVSGMGMLLGKHKDTAVLSEHRPNTHVLPDKGPGRAQLNCSSHPVVAVASLFLLPF